MLGIRVFVLWESLPTKPSRSSFHQFSAVAFCPPRILSKYTFHIHLQSCAHIHQIAGKSDALYRCLIALHMRDNRFVTAGQYIVDSLTDMLCGISSENSNRT